MQPCGTLRPGWIRIDFDAEMVETVTASQALQDVKFDPPPLPLLFCASFGGPFSQETQLLQHHGRRHNRGTFAGLHHQLWGQQHHESVSL